MTDTKNPCCHPEHERWQYPWGWLCCQCYRYFFGDKRQTPTTDIYGRKSPVTP